MKWRLQGTAAVVGGMTGSMEGRIQHGIGVEKGKGDGWVGGRVKVEGAGAPAGVGGDRGGCGVAADAARESAEREEVCTVARWGVLKEPRPLRYC